jgi:cytochrome d ubiquinol oxidase subunit I
VLTGWFTAEVGRQPWVVYGVMRTRDAVTPTLATADVMLTLAAYVTVYAVIFTFGSLYIYRLLRDGPQGDEPQPQSGTPSRPMAFADATRTATGADVRPREAGR